MTSLCEPCAAGSYVPRGSKGPCSDFLCAPGTADEDESAATKCTSCFDDSRKLFQTTAGQTECVSPSDCEAGETLFADVTAFADRV